MEKHVALLRGINVGGRRRLPMQELVRLCEGIGLTEVETLIQSGNVVFRPPQGRTPREVEAQLAASVQGAFGYDVPVMVRGASAFVRAVDSHPFRAEGVEEKTLHVGFFSEAPSEAAVASLDPERSPPDAFRVTGDVLYLCVPNGMGRTKLTGAWFERHLGITVTVRNWRTAQRLRAMVT